MNHLIRVTGRSSLALAALLLTGACDQAAGTLAPYTPPIQTKDPGPQRVDITVQPGNLAVEVGDTAQVSAVLHDSTGATIVGQAVQWSSTDTSVASVGNTGRVIAVAPGAARIVASALGARTEVPLVVAAAPGEPTPVPVPPTDSLPGPTPTPEPLPDPAPAPGASEPMFTSGVQTLLWEDDFNDKSSDADIYDAYITQNSENGLHLDMDGGLNGSRALRMDWRAKSGCTDDSHFIEAAFPSAQREVVVQWSVRYDAGFTFDWIGRGGPCYGNAKKLFFLYSQSGSRFDFISENHKIGVGSDYDHPLFAPNAGPEVTPEDLTDGQWHRITLRVRQSSTPDAKDGYIHGWIDGVQRWAVNDIASHASGGWVLLKLPSTFNQGSPVNQSEWMDDLRAWTP